MTAGLAAALAAVNGFIAVAAGAFGAHGLRKRLDADLLAVFETGARYQMYHALAMLGAAWLISRGVGPARAAAWLLLAGMVIFSGSLYALALTGVRGLGAVTPIGGVCFLAGWALMAWGAATRLGS